MMSEVPIHSIRPDILAQDDASQPAICVDLAGSKADSSAMRMMWGYPQEFVDSLNDAITSARREGVQAALLVLSVENLPMIMNGYGIELSESVMSRVLQRIGEIIAPTDLVRRIQHDQYGVIIRSITTDELSFMAERIISHIQRWDENNEFGALHVVCSLAMIALPAQADHAEEALSKSYMAIHDRNNHRGVIRSYEPRQEEAAFNRQEMGLANYLHAAILEQRLQMAYQPIICAKTGAVVHYEALLRIRSDDGKISSAGALIPIAERMGLIDVIDDMTLNMVIQELRNDPNVVLAFNVSNLTTQNRKWLERFSTLLQESPQIANRLIVEITETAAQRDLHQTAYFVAEVQSHGCQVALDDFGSGYTSFRQLKTLSVDMVKIDGAFIKDLVDNADNRFFVKTLLEFTNGFGLKSVAEYVENGEIAKMLMELGVEYLQGYYFGRPENHRVWLKNGEYDNS